MRESFMQKYVTISFKKILKTYLIKLQCRLEVYSFLFKFVNSNLQ